MQRRVVHREASALARAVEQTALAQRGPRLDVTTAERLHAAAHFGEGQPLEVALLQCREPGVEMIVDA